MKSGEVVGHLLKISFICSLFFSKGRSISCIDIGTCQYSSYLVV